MSPFGRKAQDETVPARAMVLTPTVVPGGEGAPRVTLAIELPDGSTIVGRPFWIYRDRAGVIGIGRWLPVKLRPDQPDKTQLDVDRCPLDGEVAQVIAEVLGGPAVAPVERDEWRVALALQYAERVISNGGIAPADAEAIRARIASGV
jgi:hypothetical protein